MWRLAPGLGALPVPASDGLDAGYACHDPLAQDGELRTCLTRWHSGERSMPDLPEGWSHSRRETGMWEAQCPHGVGHPNGHLMDLDETSGVHGCDGCCATLP